MYACVIICVPLAGTDPKFLPQLSDYHFTGALILTNFTQMSPFRHALLLLHVDAQSPGLA